MYRPGARELCARLRLIQASTDPPRDGCAYRRCDLGVVGLCSTHLAIACLRGHPADRPGRARRGLHPGAFLAGEAGILPGRTGGWCQWAGRPGIVEIDRDNQFFSAVVGQMSLGLDVCLACDRTVKSISVAATVETALAIKLCR